MYQIDSNCGKVIGIYEVLGVSPNKTSCGHKQYIVKCTVCGQQSEKRLTKIKSTIKCKHQLAALAGKEDKVSQHNEWSSTKLRNLFKNMKQRCYNPNDVNYPYYGAKGIKVCDEWRANPLLFEKWALKNGYQEGLTIDRIKSDGDYEPDNCRFISRKENCGRANSKNLTVDGITLSGRGWAQYLGIESNKINVIRKQHGELAAINFIKEMIQDKGINA